MAKNKGTSELRDPTPGPSAANTLGESATASAPARLRELRETSAESTLGEPENPESMDIDTDKQIEASKQMLKNLQKQRKLAETMAKVAEEQRLLVAALERAGLPIPGHLRNPATTQDEESEAEDPQAAQTERGRKRPRAETATPLPIRPPPKPAMDGLYEGRNMKEYNTFMLRMDNHFLRYASWFNNDEAKIIDGVQCLSNNLLLK
jgi:chemotaxis protein histidine kinase CheA